VGAGDRRTPLVLAAGELEEMRGYAGRPEAREGT
jgi:hypothetical protein